MADVDAATLSFEVEAGAIGFGVEGSFEPGPGELPVFDFTYTERLADDETTATIVSDGTTVTVDADGESQVLDADDERARRLAGDEGFADLGIASWVDDPREERRGDETVVSGRVDVADLLADVVRLAAQVSTAGDVELLDDATADRLATLAEVSSIEVVIGDDDIPRSVDAEIGFGRDVPGELRDALGPYAASSLRVRVTLDVMPAQRH